ncbi:MULTISPECIES: hypothetical protein [Brenneria]|uniref:Uncharacterized protein n=1 Tax=Brenneria nigrifluens DSM 30175 = ATCC 13028 TaxID=1121120 RepID=A0A2U1UK48_9GAMM|nr:MULTISPECIES: hypothetical protein [Brenneria]PWC22038.1 hypothetical protein DDT54_17475 [Brenneria nigrifluens DSM 30175 = ATCC 13028]QCR03565.1 hypothetical protein EH206_04695 [Brenneria nigrifluens DSM 30175 = ATCC 13028]
MDKIKFLYKLSISIIVLLIIPFFIFYFIKPYDLGFIEKFLTYSAAVLIPFLLLKLFLKKTIRKNETITIIVAIIIFSLFITVSDFFHEGTKNYFYLAILGVSIISFVSAVILYNRSKKQG